MVHWQQKNDNWSGFKCIIFKGIQQSPPQVTKIVLKKWLKLSNKNWFDLGGKLADSFDAIANSHSTVVFRVWTIWQDILPIFLLQSYETGLWQEKYYITYWALLGKKY